MESTSVQVWQTHSCFPSSCISFPGDNRTLHSLLLYYFIFPHVPADDQHSAQPSGTFLNIFLLCRTEFLFSDVVPKLQTLNPGLGCPSRGAELFPHPWAHPVVCVFCYLHGGLYSRYSLVTHHKHNFERKPSCFLLKTHFHSFPSRCWAGTCLSFFISCWVLLFCDKCYLPKPSFLAEFIIKLLSHIHWHHPVLGEKGEHSYPQCLGQGAHQYI